MFEKYSNQINVITLSNWQKKKIYISCNVLAMHCEMTIENKSGHWIVYKNSTGRAVRTQL